MLEMLATHEMVAKRTDWSLLPEVQITLNKRQHLRAMVGYLFPVNLPSFRARQLVFYFLWDVFDGGLRDGW